MTRKMRYEGLTPHERLFRRRVALYQKILGELERKHDPGYQDSEGVQAAVEGGEV
jgi:hypothetical protein